MENLRVKQDVELFNNGGLKGLQEVNIDPKDQWILVFHDGQEMSMKIENWKKLVALAESLINKTN